MVKIERVDDGVMMSMSGTATDLLFELGAGLDNVVESVNKHCGKDAAVDAFWDFLNNVALNLLNKGIDVLNEDGEVEEDSVSQRILDALKDMQTADDDDGTEDDLPLF